MTGATGWQMRRSLRALLCWLPLALAQLLAAPGVAQDEGYSADSIKAAFLFHFAGYVDWPTQGRSRDALTIGVIGSPGVAAELRRILPGRTIDRLPLRLREMNANDDPTGVDIVYVPRPQSDLIAHLRKQRHILIVSDVDGGLDRGAVINFVEFDRRIRFEVSMRSAGEMELKLSSRLLSAALRVKRSKWDPGSMLTLTALENGGRN
jgi:hypothetical protein